MGAKSPAAPASPKNLRRGLLCVLRCVGSERTGGKCCKFGGERRKATRRLARKTGPPRQLPDRAVVLNAVRNTAQHHLWEKSQVHDERRRSWKQLGVAMWRALLFHIGGYCAARLQEHACGCSDGVQRRGKYLQCEEHTCLQVLRGRRCACAAFVVRALVGIGH